MKSHHQTLEKSLSVLSTVFCPQLIKRTTWWEATGRVMLNTTSWPRWKKLPQDWWLAASITSNLSSLTTTSTICCPGNGTSTSKKTGQTKNRPLCLGPRGLKSPAPSTPPSPPLCVHHFCLHSFYISCPPTHLAPVPGLPDSSCSICSSSRPSLPHTMFVGPSRLCGFPRCLRASRSVPSPRWPVPGSTSLLRASPGCVRYSAVWRD